MSTADVPPQDQVGALEWLLERHPYLDSLLRRLDPHDPVSAALAVLPDAFTDPDSPAAAMVGPMSGGERRVLIAVAFLSDRVYAGVTDLYGIDLPGSEGDFMADWLACVRVGVGRW